MTNGLLNFLPNAVGQGQATVTYAEVTFPAPATFSDPLYVIEPDWTAEFSHQIASWPACHGVTLPTIGDVVLLITDSRGVRRCVWWEGQMTFSTQTSQKYYLTTASSNIPSHKEVTAAPFSPKTTVPASNLVNGQLVLDYATPPSTPGVTFLPAGQFEFHVHALQLTGNEAVRMYAEFWEYDPNSSTHVAMIGVSSPSKPLTAREVEYRLFFSTNDVYTFVSVASRIAVHVRVLVGGSGGASIRYFVGGASDSHIVIPTGNTSSGTSGFSINWRGIWNSGLTYLIGDGVTGSNGHNYVSLVGGNLNHNPVGDGGVHWSDLLPASVVSVTPNSPSRGQVLRAVGSGPTITWEPQPHLDLYDYAYVPGASDSGPVINTAITAANPGEIIRLPRGQINYTTTIAANQTTGLTLTGHGGKSAGATMGSTLLYTAAGARAIDARSSYGITITDLQAYYNNAAFSGNLIDLSHAIAQDSAYGAIERCTVGGLGITSNFCSVNVLDAINLLFRDTLFTNSSRAIQGKVVNADYSNSISVRDCRFTNHVVSPIQNPAEGWLIDACTFEPLTSGNAGAVGFNNACTGLSITVHGCWMGDANAFGDWIVWAGTSGIVVDANRFGNGLNGLRIVNGVGAMTGLTFTSNTLNSLNGVFCSNNPVGSQWTILSNVPVGGGTVHNLAVNPTPGSIFQSANGTGALTVN